MIARVPARTRRTLISRTLPPSVDAGTTSTSALDCRHQTVAAAVSPARPRPARLFLRLAAATLSPPSSVAAGHAYVELHTFPQPCSGSSHMIDKQKQPLTFSESNLRFELTAVLYFSCGGCNSHSFSRLSRIQILLSSIFVFFAWTPHFRI
jgi:hypothetical protein